MNGSQPQPKHSLQATSVGLHRIAFPAANGFKATRRVYPVVYLVCVRHGERLRFIQV